MTKGVIVNKKIEKISIIIPTYNEKENIERLIPSISKNMEGYDYEIIVVDDNSPDDLFHTPILFL